MKKLFLFFVASFLFASCATINPVILESNHIDYSKYGIFVSEANSVSFEYKPIGLVESLFMSGWAKANSKVYDDVYSKEVGVKSKNVKATREGALNKLVEEAQSIGANGIINLKFNTLSYYDKNVGYVITGYEATGMAIRR